MPSLEPYIRELGGAVAAIIAALGGLLVLNRRAVKANRENNEDRTAGSLMATLMKERNEAFAAAHVAWSQRTADARAIATLEAEKRELERKLDEAAEDFRVQETTLKRAFLRLRSVDPNAAALLFPSDWMTLDNIEGMHDEAQDD